MWGLLLRGPRLGVREGTEVGGEPELRSSEEV